VKFSIFKNKNKISLLSD